jgi:LBP / BPI / CETP family, C-terminal domain
MAVDGSAAGPGSCPIPAGPLPLSPAQIGSEAGMFSGYVHASIPDCILWGLHNAGALKTIVQDGAIPGLRLITDLFGGLIPELPKVYPKRSVMLDVVLTAPPSVTLRGPAAAAAAGGGGLLLTSVYETNVSVVGAAPDGGNVLVARLTANVSIAADLGWETSSISSVNVSYAALWQALPVSLTGWNQAIEWVVRQAGPRQSLSALWDTYVTPAVPSFIGLAAVTTSTLDDWFVLSGDVVVRTIPSSQATLRVPQPA